MSKNTDDLDMLTFQPFGDDTMVNNQEQIIKKTAQEEAAPPKRNKQEKIVTSNKTKSEKFNGIIIGFILVFLFVAYDVIMH